MRDGQTANRLLARARQGQCLCCRESVKEDHVGIKQGHKFFPGRQLDIAGGRAREREREVRGRCEEAGDNRKKESTHAAKAPRADP